MKCSTSIAAVDLAISALVPSVPATPLHARQVSYNLSCPDDNDYAQSIPESGGGSLQDWCSNQAVNLICNGPGAPVPANNYDLHDPSCDACICTTEAAAPAPVQPTCTGSMKLKPNLPLDTTPPTLQNWCLRPAVNTVCNPGVSVLGDDTENACLAACTCPS